MRISDWSSDVCSSDLFAGLGDGQIAVALAGLVVARIAEAEPYGVKEVAGGGEVGRFQQGAPFACGDEVHRMMQKALLARAVTVLVGSAVWVQRSDERWVGKEWVRK